MRNFAPLIPSFQIDSIVKQWLHDDMPSCVDVGGFVVAFAPLEAAGEKETSLSKVATLWLKSSGVFAGKPFVESVFRVLSGPVDHKETVAVEWNDLYGKEEGVYLDVQEHGGKIPIATIRGPPHIILQGERTALNILSRCSGVATVANKTVQHVRSLNWQGMVAGTRKTTPGFRIVEKYGLLVGGAATHRLDLSQMVMLKDNHIWSTGSITKAVRSAKQAAGFSSKIEVECQSKADAVEAATAGCDIVMLDNFTPAQLKQDAAQLKEQFPHLLIEASGGITIDTIDDYLSPHVDIISQGSLTQGYPCLDYSLKIEK
jgi:nicotinate-nucleotide pyrophosphorylase (carboxylating)